MTIDPEFQGLIAPLQPDELAQLEQNLIAEGCRDPLVTWHGILIDGHSRYEICKRRRIKYRVVDKSIRDLPSREDVKAWIEENQLGRRNLTDDQRAAIGLSVIERKAALEKIERARKGRARGGDATQAQKADRLSATSTAKRSEPKHDSRATVAKAARVSERKLRTAREIKQKSAAAFAKVRAGEATFAQAKREVRRIEREHRIAEAQEIAATIPVSERCQLLHCDLADAEIAAESVNLIITDPPYEKDGLELFPRLAVLATRWLKPGGSMLVMSGECHLPEVLRALDADGLRYQWTLAYLTKGQAAPIHARRICTMWKPVLWFVKGIYTGERIGCDVVESDRNDKRFHEWGQSAVGMAALIELFSLPPNQTILDPFVGGGSTAEAALRLGHRFIGVDIDADQIAMTRARVAALSSPVPSESAALLIRSFGLQLPTSSLS